MLIDPNTLIEDLERLEAIEKATLRLVVQAIWDFRASAKSIFDEEGDLVADIGEDITREALDKMGMSRIEQRLFGKIDYKRARYLFHPDFAIRQALFVDSKAEKISGKGTATLQTSQLSMIVRQTRANQLQEVQGKLPPVLQVGEQRFLTTTIFVKYNYTESAGQDKTLASITIAALPNGFLQSKYNPNAIDTIFIAGRNAPTLGEEFRVRLSFSRLRQKEVWRVQEIEMNRLDFSWME
ncbi:MAG: BglI family type II restriction endonuclease [Thermoanaerobaculia bacterium]|nr:BglI family type II restriction endonuclease [Thermoanaerobaculia bacterium]